VKQPYGATQYRAVGSRSISKHPTTLNAHADLLPFLLMNKVCHRAAVRLASLPESHPLHSHVRRMGRYVQRHRSALHELMNAFKIRPEKMERIQAVRQRPAWKRRFKTTIAESKKEAKEKEENNRVRIRIYSDESDTNGGVGAAAVLYRNGTQQRTLRYHLGTSEQHTVYEAELVAWR